MAMVRPGQDVDGYQILSPIGRGGMGEIWLAKQVSIGRNVALKILSRKLVAKDPRFAERFTAEAQAAGRLNHPNIIAVHDVGMAVVEGKPLHYFSMEYVDGENFRQIVDRDGPLDDAMLAQVMRAMASGLAYAHELGMVHRDIKPENIMLASDGRVKLADFGLAMHLAEGEEVERDDQGRVRVMGTPHYMSPEQARGLPVTFSTDHYSLGATLFTLLTGRMPYSGKTGKDVMRAHVQQPVPDPGDHADCQKAWRRLCMRLMAKAPEDRFASPQDLVDAIDDACEGRIYGARKRRRPATGTGTGHQSPATTSHLPMILIGALLVVIVGLGGTIWLLSGPSDEQGQQVTTNGNQPQRQAMIDQAVERFLADLPDDPAAAIAAIDGSSGLDNPFFADNAQARQRLEDRLTTERGRLASLQQQRQAAANDQLATVMEALAREDLVAAQAALEAIDDATRALLGARLAEQERQLIAARQRSRDEVRERLQTAEELAVIDRILAEIPTGLFPQAERQELDSLAETRRQALRAAALSAKAAAEEADRAAFAHLRDDLLDTLASSEGLLRPVDHSAYQAAIDEASEAIASDELSERVAELGKVGERAERLHGAIGRMVAQQPFTHASIPTGHRVDGLGRIGPEFSVASGTGSYSKPFWSEESPTPALIDAALKAAGLPEPDAHRRAFSWVWRCPDLAAQIQADREAPDVIAMAAIDPQVAAFRRRLAMDVDLVAADDAAPLDGADWQTATGEALHWRPSRVLDIPSLAVRQGERQLTRDDLQSLTTSLAPVRECTVSLTADLQDFMGSLSLGRGDVTWHLVLNQPYGRTGLYRSGADGVLQLVEAKARSALPVDSFAAGQRYRIQLEEDGRLQFFIGEWRYPFPASIEVPTLAADTVEEPLRIGFHCLRFPDYNDQPRPAPQADLQRLTISGTYRD